MSSRIAVVHGSPTVEELAAAVVALTPVAVPAPDNDAGTAGGSVPSRVPAWTRAALLEGVGGPPALAPTDLARHPS